MKEIIKGILIIFLIVSAILPASAQDAAGSIRGKVFSSTEGPLIGVGVVEQDATNRYVTTATTNANGEFVLKVKNPNNKLKISYIGYKAQILPIGSKKVFNIEMQEAGTTTIKDLVVKAKKINNSGSFAIPEKEISQAQQTISAKEFEGLSVPSVDDALQGKISGLDIVNNSGDLGAGASMRIRGITSINSSSEPLIVVNGVIFNTPTENFDFATANQEQFATLLCVNVDDISEITVLKDAASTAVWGAKGANGVIAITTKRGTMGKTRVNYSYRYSGSVQPAGMKMLSGDDYTMLLKESFFNPRQTDAAADKNELNYDPNFSEYENYNNNTDWVKAVTQYGESHDHSIQLQGGGERAKFMISGGYLNQTGTVIGQRYERFTSRMNLDYSVSDRIKFISEFAFTYSDNKKNYSPYNQSLLSIAYKKMPNMSIYAQDAQGNDTDRYYKTLRTMSLADQMFTYNPVAIAYLASNTEKIMRIQPTFRLNYELLDPQAEASRLIYKGWVAFDSNNYFNDTFFPKELSSSDWNANVNTSNSNATRSLNIDAENSLTYIPKFNNSDHSLTVFGNWKLGTATSRRQSLEAYGLPSSLIQDPSAGGRISSIWSSPGQGRSMSFSGVAHYAYKGKYIADLSLTRYASTKFGDDRRWGTFPGVSIAWNVADEDFMKPTRKWLSTLKFRPSWGLSGNEPRYEYLFYSLYSDYSSYAGQTTARPLNIQLTGLKWEKVTSFNYGFDLGLSDDAFMIYFDSYYKRVEDLLFPDLGIPTSSGYGALGYKNVGVMDNVGWELNLNADKLVKAGDFTMGVTLNFSNNVNTIIQMDKSVLDNVNREFDNRNGSYLTRIQERNAFGSIYGFKYLGVYQYSDYVEGRTGTSPFAIDENDRIIRDANGEPVRMTFNYDPKNAATVYQFKGGDAIYEDINHDGTINELDIVYLGNSNPLMNGGFSLKFKYKQLSMNIFSNYRLGNKVVNSGRMYAENMYGTNNQCASVNWRWRKSGDLTEMPRAMYQSGYNWLGSDRYVEDGSFLRVKNLQVNYSLPKKMLKPFLVEQLNLYLTVNNLFVLTKYSGVDPEVGYGGMGISYDGNQTPRAKSFTASVSVMF